MNSGVTLYIDAGLTANVDELGRVQRAALAIYSGVRLAHDEPDEWCERQAA